MYNKRIPFTFKVIYVLVFGIVFSNVILRDRLTGETHYTNAKIPWEN